MSTEATYIQLIFTSLIPQIFIIVFWWVLILGLMVRFLRSL